MLMQVKEMCRVNVRVSRDEYLNRSKGIISDRDLRGCDEEELVEDVPGVIHARRMEVRRGGEKINTFVLTFDSPTPPAEIKVGYLDLKVRPFVPTPMRCFKCHRYGHGSERCRRQEAICARCGRTGHKIKECPNDPRCINCGGDHAASDRNCPKFQEEKAILHYRAYHGGTFQQARAAVVVEVAREIQARSFATVVRKGPTKLGGAQAKKSIQTTPAPAKAAPPRERLVGEPTQRNRGTIEKTPTARFGTQPDVPLEQINSIWETQIEKILHVGRTISPHPSPSPPLPPSIAQDESDMDADLGAALGEASPKYPSTQNVVNRKCKGLAGPPSGGLPGSK
ncbi:nucleic-acid-binding protein from mobile element jockey [Elysia marginata]|uniref:Nucleic-acid-binding protein from mobile element jockey n=1 Tax=Elysia marginata TaxID=1093978 RepID=A0AAV4EW89_9GAST|nr:nucleic-acid-binding protein from mobile element jockey [Elysia marginata]